MAQEKSLTRSRDPPPPARATILHRPSRVKRAIRRRRRRRSVDVLARPGGHLSLLKLIRRNYLALCELIRCLAGHPEMAGNSPWDAEELSFARTSSGAK